MIDISWSSSPFRHFIIDSFVSEPDFRAIHALSRNKQYNARRTDLFCFRQSDELKGEHTVINNLLGQKYFDEEFIGHLEAVSGRKLGRQFDTSFQVYGYGDHLFPHDDLLENRAFAYVLYLVDDSYTEECGGALALLDSDVYMSPRRVVKRVHPSTNRLIVFEVSRISFHYVEEVLASSKSRYSLTGWFYFDDVPDFNLNLSLPGADKFFDKYPVQYTIDDTNMRCGICSLPLHDAVNFMHANGAGHAKYLKKAVLLRFSKWAFLIDSTVLKHDWQLIQPESKQGASRVVGCPQVGLSCPATAENSFSIKPTTEDQCKINVMLLYFQ